MKISFTLFIPEGVKDTKEVLEIWNNLLKQVKVGYNVRISKEIIDKEKEDKIKFEILLPLAVRKRIKIHQTRRTKSLYPQLVIFLQETPFTFYSQGYGKDQITIKQFLEGLLKGNVYCLHDKEKLEKHLSQKQKGSGDLRKRK
jgi:hypothetical protein